MRYKTSCFNPTLARNSLLRFWPLPLGVFGFYLLTLALPFYNRLSNQIGMTLPSAVPYTSQAGVEMTHEEVMRLCGEYIYSSAGIYLALLACFALLAALLLFRHLHSRREIQFYLALPIRRRCLYLTAAVMGYLMVLLPVLLAELVTMLISLGLGSAYAPVLWLMLATVTSFTIFYGMAVFCCVLAGQAFGAMLLYGGMHCAAWAILTGMSAVVRYFLPGYDQVSLFPGLIVWLTPLSAVTELFQAGYYDGITGNDTVIGLARPEILVVHAIAGVLLLVLSAALYQKRPGETAGEMISFRMIRPVCKVLASLAVSMVLTYALVSTIPMKNDITFLPLLLLVLVTAAAGWIAAEMIIRKTFRVFKKQPLMQCGIMLAALLAVLCFGKLDIIGYEDRIPDVLEVVSAEISPWYNPVRVTPEDAISLHETILANKAQLSNNTSIQEKEWVHIIYQMKDGTVLERGYCYFYHEGDMITQKINEISSKPEVNYRTWFPGWEDNLTEGNFSNCYLDTRWSDAYIVDGKDDPYASDTVHNTNACFVPGEAYAGDPESARSGNFSFSAAQAVTLYYAVVRDIEDGNLPPQTYRYTGESEALSPKELGTLYFERNGKEYDASMGSYAEYSKKTVSLSAYISIRQNMTHTLSALEEMGVELNPSASP